MSEIRDGVEGKVERSCPEENGGDEGDEREQRGCKQGGARGGVESNPPPRAFSSVSSSSLKGVRESRAEGENVRARARAKAGAMIRA